MSGRPRNWRAVLHSGEDGIARVLWVAAWLTERVADETGASILYDYPDSPEVLNEIDRTVASVPSCTRRQAAAFYESRVFETMSLFDWEYHDNFLTSISEGKTEAEQITFAYDYTSGMYPDHLLKVVLDSAYACKVVVSFVNLSDVAMQAGLFEKFVNEDYDGGPAVDRYVEAAVSLVRLLD